MYTVQNNFAFYGEIDHYQFHNAENVTFIGSNNLNLHIMQLLGMFMQCI